MAGCQKETTLYSLSNRFHKGAARRRDKFMSRVLCGLISGTTDTTRRATRLALLVMIAAALTNVCGAQQATATLKIQLDKPTHAVSRTLYGLMTEEINYSYDGGLYAEMVRNRTFQDHGFGGVAHWFIEHRGD